MTDHVDEPALDLLGMAKDAWWIIGTVVAALILIYRARDCYKLWRATFKNDERGTVGTAIGILIAAHWNRFVRMITSEAPISIYDSVRIRIEHEIFRMENRQLSTPNPFSDMTIDDRNTRGERPLNAGDVNDAFARIGSYFAALSEQKRPPRDLHFLCTLTIDTGFVTPLHLLAGALTRFGEDWPKIVDTYNYDVESELKAPWLRPFIGSSNKAPGWVQVLLKVQRFNFACWLQWGPSIPSSAVDKDDQALASLQYGFGDENNSIELVRDRAGLTKTIKQLWEPLHLQKLEPLAIPAKVSGKIAHSAVFATDSDNKVSAALKSSWRTEGKGKVLLKDFDIDSRIERSKEHPQFYSAYMWVMFIILKRDGSGRSQSPEDALHQQEPSWLELFPFFEHCNIACHAALLVMKRQLALKAVQGIHRVVELAKAEGKTDFPFRFSFACAIDEPGDGSNVWLPRVEWPTPACEASAAFKMTTLIEELNFLASDQKYAHLFAEPHPIIDLRYSADTASRNPYSACGLIAHTEAVLVHMKSVSDELSARQVS